MLVFEDIHWADHGMLDLIEYLAQWVRGPLVLLCLARDELLDRRARWGGGRHEATSILLEPLTVEQTRDLVAAVIGVDDAGADAVAAIAERAGGNPFFAEEMARRLADESSGELFELPETVQSLLAARLDSLEPSERILVQHAAVFGRTFWEGALGTAGLDDAGTWDALMRLQEKDIIVPESGGVRLAGEREFAFKHVLIRDVAYGMLPRAVRCRKHFQIGRYIEERAGERADEVVALLAEHFGRSATLCKEAALEGAEVGLIHQKALQYLEAAGDAAARLYSNPEAYEHYEAVRRLEITEDPATVARVLEKEGDVAFRMGRVGTAVELWEECLEHHRRQEDLTRVADLHRKIGAGLWNQGERKLAIERYQKGINLLKDGPPCLELVHLYEEAASLYMHAGDNMLAIYASEKALRLAEKLQETRVASRAHGIFGRVFGRIGDKEKARENLERSVELARDSDDGETIRALLTLGHHLEVSEADYAGAGQAYGEALHLAQQVGDLPAQVELQSSIAQVASYRAAWDEVATAAEASADLAEREGLVGKLCYPLVLRGVLAWREGRWDDAQAVVHARPRAGRAGRMVGGLVCGALLARSLAARQRRPHGGGHRDDPRARRVRTRRPDRPVDRGDLDAGHHARDGRKGGRCARRRGGGGAAGGAPALPRRQGGRPDGQGDDLGGPGRGTSNAERVARAVGRASAGRSTLRSRICCWATPSPNQRPDEARAALGARGGGVRASRRRAPVRLGQGARLERMPTAQLPDGVEIHWDQRGEGPLVVISNQFFSEAWVFEGLTALLAEDHRVVTYDPRGTGRSSRQRAVRRSRPTRSDLVGLVEVGRPAGRPGRDGRRLQPRRARGGRPARPGRCGRLRRRKSRRSVRGRGHRRPGRVGVGAGRADVDDGDRLPRRAAHDDRHREPGLRRGDAADARQFDVRELPPGRRCRAHALVDRRRCAGAGPSARATSSGCSSPAATRGSRSRSRGAHAHWFPEAHIQEVEDGALSRPDITVDVVRALTAEGAGSPERERAAPIRDPS